MANTIDEADKARILRVFHPTIHVPSLEEADAWFTRVFGRGTVSMATIMPSTPNYPTDYAAFAMIQDVLLDFVDPKKHMIAGNRRYPDVDRPTLKSIGWYADGLTDLYHQLRDSNVPTMDMWNKVAEGDTPPLAPNGEVVTYFTMPQSTGLQYQFIREAPFPLDPRTQGDWTLPTVQADDALGVERSYSHVILTQQIDRALHFFVTALGGRIVAERRNPIVQGDATFIALADSIYEFVVPDAGSDAHRRLAEKDGLDLYHTITWKVADLAQAERHLIACGVTLRTKMADTIESDPETSFSIPWIFTDADLPA